MDGRQRISALLLAVALASYLFLSLPLRSGAQPDATIPSPTGTPAPASFLPMLLNPPPSPTATATLTPTATPDTPSWLHYLNQFRDAAQLPHLTENPAWTQGEWLHSRYMVMEDHASHSESPSSPWYSEEGDIAGRNGNIFVSGWASAVDAYAIDFWMSGPFHAVAMLDPQLYETAFDSYREATGYWHMGATLDWARGLGALPSDITFPIFFPADDGQTWLVRHPGYEFPDPLSSCPGYTAPTGPPLIVQLGSGSLTPQVTAHSFAQEGGDDLEHCVFDETTYANPSPTMQNSGRRILNSRDAVVLMPRSPLQVGNSYVASITSKGTTHRWRFTVVSPPRPAYSVPQGMDHVLMP
ncbi:MAG: CAP domain-containing protein [Chloroflexota bacterium]